MTAAAADSGGWGFSAAQSLARPLSTGRLRRSTRPLVNMQNNVPGGMLTMVMRLPVRPGVMPIITSTGMSAT
jgi:hypothetical protein